MNKVNYSENLLNNALIQYHQLHDMTSIERLYCLESENQSLPMLIRSTNVLHQFSECASISPC